MVTFGCCRMGRSSASALCNPTRFPPSSRTSDTSVCLPWAASRKSSSWPASPRQPRPNQRSVCTQCRVTAEPLMSSSPATVPRAHHQCHLGRGGRGRRYLPRPPAPLSRAKRGGASLCFIPHDPGLTATHPARPTGRVQGAHRLAYHDSERTHGQRALVPLLVRGPPPAQRLRRQLGRHVLAPPFPAPPHPDTRKSNQ